MGRNVELKIVVARNMGHAILGLLFILILN